MKVDYLSEGAERCPLIRLYDFQIKEARSLMRAFESLATGAVDRIDFDTVTPVESVDGTRVTFVRGAKDRGIIETAPHHFIVMLAAEQWRVNAEIVSHFCEGSFGYDWLAPETSDIQLLLSKCGDW